MYTRSKQRIPSVEKTLPTQESVLLATTVDPSVQTLPLPPQQQ